MDINAIRFVSRFIVSSAATLAKLDTSNFHGSCTAVTVWISSRLINFIDIEPVSISRIYITETVPTFKYRGHDFLWIPSINLYYDPTAMQLGLPVPMLFSSKSIPLLYNVKEDNIIRYNRKWIADNVKNGIINNILKSRPYVKDVLSVINTVYIGCMSSWDISDSELKDRRIKELLGVSDTNGS